MTVIFEPWHELPKFLALVCRKSVLSPRILLDRCALALKAKRECREVDGAITTQGSPGSRDVVGLAEFGPCEQLGECGCDWKLNFLLEPRPLSRGVHFQEKEPVLREREVYCCEAKSKSPGQLDTTDSDCLRERELREDDIRLFQPPVSGDSGSSVCRRSTPPFVLDHVSPADRACPSKLVGQRAEHPRSSASSEFVSEHEIRITKDLGCIGPYQDGVASPLMARRESPIWLPRKRSRVQAGLVTGMSNPASWACQKLNHFRVQRS